VPAEPKPELHSYDIILRATLEIHGVFTGEQSSDAVSIARSEMLTNGQILDLETVQCIRVEEGEAPPIVWG
jgi:hypothetical protein